MTKRLALLFSALCLLLPAVTPERLDRQARAYYELKRFNGAVLVAEAGKPLLARGYGMANYEWSVPAAPDTRFRLGSITKQFTAMAILLLEQEGKLSVDDPVSRHWSDAPEAWRGITIHQLLTHTSGLYNYTALPGYARDMRRAKSPVEILRDIAERPLEFQPGTQMKYSNSGYVLLGLLIERLSGMSYAEFVRSRIFEPLGMNDTGYDSDTAILPRRAAGYEWRGEELRNAQFLDMSLPHAAGALYSTCTDLLKWDAALREQKLLGAENYRRYFTPDKNDYAYGWIVKERNGAVWQSHGGGINGFSTMIIRVPAKELLVVALANTMPSQAGRLAEDLASLALGDERPAPQPRHEISLPRETLSRYVGQYELRPGFILTVTMEGGQLMTQATGQPRIPVFAESERRFFPKVVDATLEFEVNAAGEATAVVLEQGGSRIRGPRK